MRQNDDHFIHILNRIQTSSQTNDNTHFMNNFCLRPPPTDNTLPHLFYTNLKTTTHNKIVYEKTPSDTFKIHTKDFRFETCPFHFKLSILPSHTNGHHKLLLLKNMLMELCVRNYATLNGLVNAANGGFEDYIENNVKPLIWIYFHNPQIGINT